jgi:hypothetical protein
VAIVLDYDVRIAGAKATIGRHRLAMADALIHLNHLMERFEDLPWPLRTSWFGSGHHLSHDMDEHRATIAKCSADIDKEEMDIRTGYPNERDHDLGLALVLEGGTPFPIIEETYHVLTDLQTKLSSAASALGRFDDVDSCRALAAKIDQAFKDADDGIKRLHEALRQRAFDFAMEYPCRDRVLNMASRLYRHEFKDSAPANWLEGLKECLRDLEELKKAYIGKLVIDAHRQIDQRKPDVTP